MENMKLIVLKKRRYVTIANRVFLEMNYRNIWTIVELRLGSVRHVGLTLNYVNRKTIRIINAC
jgi:hypothetical protein